MGKLFGTDGIRGVVNAGLDADLAYRVGLATATVLAKAKGKGERTVVTIGKDTRISGDLLKGSLIAGLCTAGADVLDLGTLPTPGVAWVTVDQKADAGIVISASHNPFQYNGIKIFNGEGFKLSDELEEKIEEFVLFGHSSIPVQTGANIGSVTYFADRAVDDYIDYLYDTVDTTLSGLRILVDCANGASYTTATRLFAKFPKLRTDVINAKPDGVNINDHCGSTYMDSLAAMVKAGGYDIGIAFDGDADRCLAVDELGNLVDGDQIMAACGIAMKGEGTLAGDTVVATVMSNLGLHVFARENGLKLVCTDVGDRNVLEQMVASGYRLGGEQSGHMIFLEHATTGDGQLAALQLLAILRATGKKASQLFGVCERYPQVLINIAVEDNDVKKHVMRSDKLAEAIKLAEGELAEDGRVLVRPSGTEALMRVMVEAKTQDTAQATAEKLAQIIRDLASVG